MWPLRKKATILETGIIDEDGNPRFWHFDCGGKVAACKIRNGVLIVAGYTIDELYAISEKVQARS